VNPGGAVTRADPDSMICERVQEELAEQREADLALPPHLRRHLEDCPACRRFHESLSRGRAILRSLPAVPVSHDFFDGLQGRIDRLDRRLTLRRRGVAAGRAAIAGALAAVLVSLLVPSALQRAAFRGRSAPDSRGSFSGPPAVSVLRPFSALAELREGSLFAGPADLSARPLEPAADRLDPALLGLLPAGTRAGLDPAPPAGPVQAYRRRPVPEGRQPVLVATPSWTFAAPPVAFQFLNARARTTFPPPPP